MAFRLCRWVYENNCISLRNGIVFYSADAKYNIFKYFSLNLFTKINVHVYNIAVNSGTFLNAARHVRFTVITVSHI